MHKLGLGLALALVFGASGSTARADGVTTLEQAWPTLPADRAPSLEQQITDRLTDLGNRFGNRIDALSHDFVALRVDGRGQRAQLRVGGGNPRYLSFEVDSDWHFTDGQAHVKARVNLAIAGHAIDLKLPDMDVIPDNYRGQQLVQVNVPVFDRRF